MTANRASRRRFVAGASAAAAATIAAPHVSTAQSAGKLTIALWDHWVPGANKASTAVIEAWAAKEKVEVQIDYITSQGNKLLLTEQAEALAKTGHDIMTFRCWGPGDHARILEPVDDIMADLIKQHGAVNATTEYLGKHGGHWAAVPCIRGSNVKGPCSRIDLLKQHAGIDVVAMYPPGEKPKANAWTYDSFLKAAEACQKAGFPFGIGLGTTSDSVDSAGAIFAGFGASLVDAKGNLTVKTDAMRQAIEYYVRLARFLPSDAPSYDDASNNKILVAGKSALILNPPSGWAVAKRDAPKVAEQLWTHGMPVGPKGRFTPWIPWFWGIWGFGKNKSAAKSLLRHMSQRPALESMVVASQGFDNPAYANLMDLKVWEEEAPPKGTLFHYPNRYDHQQVSIAGAPAPAKIAVQIYVHGTMTKMIVRHMQGEPMEKTLAWAETELEGFMR
jgi:ABC-type glycerol-3-phosphate transport system substrate-binding protein